MSKKVSPALRKRLQAEVRKSAKDMSAEACESWVSFIFMGPVPDRDRVIGNAWQSEANRKRKQS